MPPPLQGVRVLDCTVAIAGPVCSGILGDQGAEVIKVENTTRQGVGHGNRAALNAEALLAAFSDVNRSKLGITLNLNVPEARDIFRRLVAISDVVVENFSPRVMRNFGLEYQDLVKVKPDIIVASMPAFGKDGPMRDRTSFGPGIDAMSGLSHLTGYPDSTPLKPGNYYCDYNAGLLAAMSIMAALFFRKRHGKGQAIEAALRDGETQLIGEYILDYALNGRVQQRMANRHPTMAPHGVYRCRGDDRWIAISVGDDREWQALASAIGKPELGSEPRFATVLARKENEAAIDEVMAEWTARQDHIEAMRFLQDRGVPAAACFTTEEMASDPQFTFRRVFLDVELTQDRKIRLPRVGWVARQAQSNIRRGPAHGEHTVKVLKEYLKLSDAEIASLAQGGAISLPSEQEALQ